MVLPCGGLAGQRGVTGKTARWLLAGHSSLAGQSPAGEDHPVIPGKVLPPGRAALTA